MWRYLNFMKYFLQDSYKVKVNSYVLISIRSILKVWFLKSSQYLLIGQSSKSISSCPNLTNFHSSGLFTIALPQPPLATVIFPLGFPASWKFISQNEFWNFFALFIHIERELYWVRGAISWLLQTKIEVFYSYNESHEVMEKKVTRNKKWIWGSLSNAS